MVFLICSYNSSPCEHSVIAKCSRATLANLVGVLLGSLGRFVVPFLSAAGSEETYWQTNGLGLHCTSSFNWLVTWVSPPDCSQFQWAVLLRLDRPIVPSILDDICLSSKIVETNYA